MSNSNCSGLFVSADLASRCLGWWVIYRSIIRPFRKFRDPLIIIRTDEELKHAEPEVAAETILLLWCTVYAKYINIHGIRFQTEVATFLVGKKRMMEAGVLVPRGWGTSFHTLLSDQKYCHLSLESDAVIILCSIDFPFSLKRIIIRYEWDRFYLNKLKTDFILIKSTTQAQARERRNNHHRPALHRLLQEYGVAYGTWYSYVPGASSY